MENPLKGYNLNTSFLDNEMLLAGDLYQHLFPLSAYWLNRTAVICQRHALIFVVSYSHFCPKT